jgi:hypothetical protein
MEESLNLNSPAHPKLTNRSDFWWLLPLLMLLGFIVAGGYLTWAALVGENFAWGPYVSPVYASPYVPSWWTLSPALLLLWIPAGFRLTCYYGRKAYYRAAFANPGACAVEQPHRKNYKGETRLPFILNNLHRYFLYLALALLALHWYEWVAALFYQDSIYVGLGTIIVLLDTIALTFYVGGCHSLRHIIGGKKRSFVGCCGCAKKNTCSKAGYGMWKKVSALNIFHGTWFWVSLFSILLADLYIRLLAMGILSSDPHIIF